MAGFGGASIFNPSSPSSYPRPVAKIVEDYVVTAVSHPARVLDIGGTRQGFLKQATTLPAGTEFVIVNPEAGVGATYPDISAIPGNDAGYDLVMAFGLIMYFKPDDLIALMRSVRQRLRPGGTFLIAEPDPEHPAGRVDMAAKTIARPILTLFGQGSFTFYSRGDATEFLRATGYNRIAERPDLVPTWRETLPRAALPPYYVVAAGV